MSKEELLEVSERMDNILRKLDEKLRGIEKELKEFKKELKEFDEKLDREFNRRERMLMDLENLRWVVRYILYHNRKYSGYEMYRVRKGDGINSTRTKWVRHPFF